MSNSDNNQQSNSQELKQKLLDQEANNIYSKPQEMGLDNQNSNQIYPIQQHEQSQDFNINQSLRETTKSNVTPNDSQKPNGKFGQSWENSNDNTGIFKEEHKQNEKDNLITPYKKQAQNDQPHNDQPPVSKKDVDQPAKPVNPTKKLMKYMKNERWLFFWSTIALVLGNAGQFAVPYYIGLFVDNMKDEKFDDIPSLCYQLVGIIFFSSIAVFYRGMYYSVISEKIARNLRQDLYESLVNKDVEFFDSRKTGDLLSRIGSDTAVIQEGLSTNVSMFLRSFIFIIVSFIFLFILSWQLTLAMIASIMPVILFSVFYGNMMKNAQKHIQDGKAYISTLAEETFSNIRTVKAFATEKEETLRYSKGNDTVYKYGYYKSFWYGIFNFFANFFVFGSMAVIVGLGSKLYQDGEITIGEITAFLFYMMQILMNFMILASVLGSVMSIIGASVKIVEILEYIPKINTSGGNKIEGQIIGEVTIRDVKFHYPTKKDVQVLKGVTIDIKKNRVVALVGPSGCGKSSLISMIERFYDPIEGVVEFDGVDVKTLDPKWYHSQVAIVQQEPVLFSGSIKENIGYGLPEDQVTEETLDWACKQANAYEFIHDKDLFPEGYSTIVGERGVKLSGGQKQRIAIARALIRKPKILLLDEATSALDAESEHQVQKALDELIKSGEQTIIVIAHRLSTIRDADEIIVIRKGEVAERGSHEELLKKGGVYKSLVERQLMSMQLEEK